MKFVRFEDQEGNVKIGAIKGEDIVDLVDAGSRWTTIRDIVAAGDEALPELAALVKKASPARALEGAMLHAPIERPGKYLAIGMNYAKHLEEADKLGVARSKHQVWFNKQTSCIVGPYDMVEPGVTEKLDYEVELAAIIGRPAKLVDEADALQHVFGYTVANDVSARDYQFHSATFTMGKSFDTHGPIGPWIVTADEVADPQNLDLRCYVNGELRQSNNTSQMIHTLAKQIAYLSQAFTLESGDLIATGTPEGVGIGMEPQQFLKSGDVVRCEVDGVGVIENRIA